MAVFKRPVHTAYSRDIFSEREVGINHPDNGAFVKISDNGMIEIIAGEGLGIVIDPHSRSINLFGDSVKFHTRDNDGLRWNRLSFNHRSTKYVEPTFVEQKTDDIVSIYDGIDNILDD